jgi:hypothetical protein
MSTALLGKGEMKGLLTNMINRDADPNWSRFYITQARRIPFEFNSNYIDCCHVNTTKHRNWRSVSKNRR